MMNRKNLKWKTFHVGTHILVMAMISSPSLKRMPHLRLAEILTKAFEKSHDSFHSTLVSKEPKGTTFWVASSIVSSAETWILLIFNKNIHLSSGQVMIFHELEAAYLGNPLQLHQCLPWSLSSQASMSDRRVCPVVLRDHKDGKGGVIATVRPQTFSIMHLWAIWDC